MIESKMHKKLRDTFHDTEFQRIESTTGLGIPDEFFFNKDTAGWIELKEIPSWPKRQTTDITIPWRPGQLAWATRYLKGGCSPYLLIFTIGDEWFVMDKHNLKKKYTQDELKYHCYIGTTSEIRLSKFMFDKLHDR